MQQDPDAHAPVRALEQLKEAVVRGELDAIPPLLDSLHPAEIADGMESMPQEQRSLLWNRLMPEVRGEVLLELHGDARSRMIDEADTADLIAAVRRLQGDELADLEAQLPPEILDGALRAMDKDRLRRYQQVRSFPDDMAGGLMDADAVAVREDVSVALVMRYLRLLRQRWRHMPEHMDSVVVIDESGRYKGMLRLSDLVSAEPRRAVAELMVTDIAPIPADTPAPVVAHLFENRDLISAPVTDADGKVIGRITVDDIVDVIRAEGEHRALRPAGLSEETDIFAPVTTNAKSRAIWLGIHLAGAFAAAAVVSAFERSIEQLVALAVLMPVVATMGGVAGNQTVTLVTRGLALRQVDRSNTLRMLSKELGVALLNGALWAVIVGAVALIWFGHLFLGAVFGVAMLTTLLVSALSGALIPVAMSNWGIDPAVSAGVVVTAIADVMGFLVFLGLATMLLL